MPVAVDEAYENLFIAMMMGNCDDYIDLKKKLVTENMQEESLKDLEVEIMSLKEWIVERVPLMSSLSPEEFVRRLDKKADEEIASFT